MEKIMAENRLLVKVKGVYPHETADENAVGAHLILFQDDAGREMPMFIGQSEARGVSIGLQDTAPARPFTFEAMFTCLSVTGAAVEEAYINEIKDETFYALVSLRVNDEVRQVDMRPSDAVNLALRAKCPILINDEVFKTVLESRQSAA
jgi:hypothetical protein